ncbi:hypothetical protein EZV62_007616 [Acer yangbiense]|uniref:Uncharacterized protein n=1 Tax=Acer yangbiense TaxID=1000413 RepID=A0A5C7IB70_9ROSI|nr:hypothetical protein EZV62_007616 [Acer yangbiense]
MVKKAARKCSHCGHYGHNSRTCNGGKSFKLFGVNIENSRKGSMSMENMQEMVKEAARKCSHCGHYGHNSRTCNGGKSFKLFSVNIENPRKGSMSMENMQSVVDVHVEAGSPSDGKRDKAVRIAWTEKEQEDFLAGLNMLGKGDWRGISMYFVKTRSPSQVASHAQKFFLRQASPDNKKRRASLLDMRCQQSASFPYVPAILAFVDMPRYITYAHSSGIPCPPSVSGGAVSDGAFNTKSIGEDSLELKIGPPQSPQ